MACAGFLMVGCNNTASVSTAASVRPEAPASVAGKTFVYYPQTHACTDDVCSSPMHKKPWSLTWLNSNERKEAPVDGWHRTYTYTKVSDTEARVFWFSTNDIRGTDITMHLHFTSPTGGTATFECDSGIYIMGSSGKGTFTLK